MGRDYDRIVRPRMKPRAPWTALEVTTLRFEWHLATKMELVRRLPGRSWSAIRQRAAALGLPMGVPEGCVSIRAAARRLGVHPDTLHKILGSAGAPVHRLYAAVPRRSRVAFHAPHQYVDWDDARAALERWMQTETVRGASLRLGLHHATLRRWLLAEGVIARRGPGAAHRVPSAVIERVVAEHARTARAA